MCFSDRASPNGGPIERNGPKTADLLTTIRIAMTQETKPEPNRPAEPYRTRSIAEVLLLTAAVLTAFGALAALITRFLTLAAPVWFAMPAGILLSLVFVSTLVIAVGKTTRNILAATAAIVLIVALLWSLPSKLRVSHQKHSSRLKLNCPIRLAIGYV